jgi:hypothetical protein
MTIKKIWSQPTVTEFGNVVALTLAGHKVHGVGDAFAFEGDAWYHRLPTHGTDTRLISG